MQSKSFAKGYAPSFLVMVFTIFTFGSCQDDLDQEASPSLKASSDSYMVKTGEVNQQAGFYFLSPIVKEASYSGTFDESLSPVVEICPTADCGTTLHASFTVDGSGSEKVRVNMEEEHYVVNWNTKATGAAVGQTYRVRVTLGEQVLGYFDVKMISSGAQAKTVAPGLAALVAGQTLPVKFRIEKEDDGGVQVPGRDIVVFNDINMFDNTAMENPNNVRLVQNLVNFTTAGDRNDGKVVWMDRGRGSYCYAGNECDDSNWATMKATMTAEGFSIENILSTAGSLTSIPANVKVIFLVMPILDYTTPEVNTLKQFAADGGRIVFIGEHSSYYQHIPVQNQLLISLGAVLRNTGGAVDCGYNVLPATSMREHQITVGVTDVTMACASVIEPGAEDFALFYDKSNSRVLAGVAKIDVTPIAAQLVVTSARMTINQIYDETINYTSASGR